MWAPRRTILRGTVGFESNLIPQPGRRSPRPLTGRGLFHCSGPDAIEGVRWRRGCPSGRAGWSNSPTHVMPKLLHHAPGTPVSDEREGDQFRNAGFRGVCDACPGRLGGVTLAPGVVPQPPEYLDLALQPAGERHAVQSGESRAALRPKDVRRHTDRILRSKTRRGCGRAGRPTLRR